MSQRFSLEPALKTSGVTKSDVKEAIKNQLEDASKRKGGEKTQIMQMIGLIWPMLIKIWDCIQGMIFYSLILGHMNSFSVRLKRTDI